MDKVGRYELKSEVGRGGMATVYLAHDPAIGRDVAIKVLPREFLHDSTFKTRFEREAKTIASLEHHAIVPIHDFGEHEGQPYIVMRYMPGGSLEQRLEKGPLPVDEILKVVERIASALSEAHEQGIIHRDLKPGNILFDRRGDAYLADFGISKLREATANITGSAIIGTPTYMSPEQIQGDRQLDGRSDVYALGIVLFEMLTGQKPYKADTPAKMLMAHILEPVPRVLEAKGDLPEGIEEVTNRALAKQPDDRFSTADDLSSALKAAVSGKGKPLPSESFTKIPPKRKERVKSDNGKGFFIPAWGWIGIGIGVIGLVIIGLMNGSGGEGSMAPLDTDTVTPVTSEPLPTKIPTQTKQPSQTPLSKNFVDDFGHYMALIPAGEFNMGSDTGENDEAPVHTVYLDDFYIDQYEITNEQYADFLNQQGNQSQGGKLWLDSSDADVRIHQSGGEWKADLGYGDHPVIEVTWYGANAYCDWRGARLPSEAEWEKTARGLEERTYPWGEGITCTKANYLGCVEDTASVGMYLDGVSAYNVYDMAGNVFEWVSDWYDDKYYRQSPLEYPTGPGTGENRVLRGGSWLSSNKFLTVTNRGYSSPISSDNFFGFRCVVSYMFTMVNFDGNYEGY